MKSLARRSIGLLACLVAPPLMAQQTGPGAGDLTVRPCSIDSALARRMGVLTLSAVPSAPVSDMSVTAAAERALVMEMQEAFVPPDTLNLWPFPGTAIVPNGSTISSLGGSLGITIRDGQVTGRVWTVEPRALFRHAIVQAMDRAVASDAFRAAAAALPGGRADFTIRIQTSGTEDPVGVVLYRARVPYLEITEPARRLGGPNPEWPKGAGRTNAYVDLEFVVNEIGGLVPGGFWVIGYSDPRFIASATRAIEGGTYSPATIMGCPVRQLVNQRISFKSE